MKEGNKLRCDHCGKWKPLYDLVTLPEELYPILTMDNEFGVCWECVNTYDIEYWKTWIPKARKKKKPITGGL